jgi:hypothetical protein
MINKATKKGLVIALTPQKILQINLPIGFFIALQF